VNGFFHLATSNTRGSLVSSVHPLQHPADELSVFERLQRGCFSGAAAARFFHPSELTRRSFPARYTPFTAMIRRFLPRIFLAVMTITSPLAAAGPSEKRTAWFEEARFGMFIHFGLYAIPARGEWVRHAESLSNDDYQIYFDTFNPTAFNPREWAQLARAAGMKYAVMTAKHHDGFCLWDSKYTEYKATNTPAGRDLIREYVEAFREAGLKVGLYYSLIDWHHPDYPAYGDTFHPMRSNEAYRDRPGDFARYLDYMHNQVEELVTQFGVIDIMWFDFSYGEMSGEKWKADELVSMVRQHQPQIILNNRLGGDGASTSSAGSLGDFETPEQGVPERGRVDPEGNPTIWEACITLNNHWGYHANDAVWKSPELVVHTLVNCVSKGGNLLLNVGPDATGRIPEPSQHILREVGQWMERNHRSIYGCGPADLPKPEWGRFTRNGRFLYAHVMHPHIGHINIKGESAEKVRRVRVLTNGAEAFIANTWWGDHSTDNLFINVNKETYRHYPLPDPINTVYEIEFEEGEEAASVAPAQVVEDGARG
jgi:alpha-L-fucosidase